MSANRHANGGLLRRDLKLPDLRDYAVEVPDDQKGKILHENTRPAGKFLRDLMRENMTNFRLFGPDETASNQLQAVYEVSKKVKCAPAGMAAMGAFPIPGHPVGGCELRIPIFPCIRNPL